jgi:alcohol dehydrogenase class IV
MTPQPSSDAEAARCLAEELQALIRRLGLPSRLRDVGVSQTDLTRIARQFIRRGASLTGTSPASEMEVEMLLESAW